jgi:diguanylate cyclase (GGDEF)-like protein
MAKTESGWITQAIAWIGAQRDGSRAARAAFVCWMCVPVYLLFSFWALAGWVVAATDSTLDGEVLSYATLYGFTMTLAWVAAAVYGMQLDDLDRPGTRFSRLVLFGYAATTALTCYLVGTLNIICGLVMMGAPLLGMMLFPLAEILALFTVAIVAVLGASVASALGVLPYAPILNTGLLNTSEPGLYYAMSGIVGSALYVAYQTIIMAALIRTARARESDFNLMSGLDPLTGVANRQQIMSMLRRRLAQHESTSSALAIALVDIGGIREISIRYGQSGADSTIAAAAHALRGCLRSHDTVGRLHDNVFMVILPDTSLAPARDVARRCRDAVLQGRPHGLAADLTVRTGVADCSGYPLPDADELLRQAANNTGQENP